MHKYSNKHRQSWIKNHANNEFIHCICECAKNLLKGKVPLTSQQKRLLSKNKNKLRTLVKKKISVGKKKKIIQTGGFLGALLGPIVSILGGLLGVNNK